MGRVDYEFLVDNCWSEISPAPSHVENNPRMPITTVERKTMRKLNHINSKRTQKPPNAAAQVASMDKNSLRIT